MRCDLSIRQFCDAARARFENCNTFESKRQFLLDFVERIIYDRYRLTVIGSVPINTQICELQKIETRKLAFCLRREIDKTTLHKKPRKKFAEDGRLKAYGSGGRNEPCPSVPLPKLTVDERFFSAARAPALQSCLVERPHLPYCKPSCKATFASPYRAKKPHYAPCYWSHASVLPRPFRIPHMQRPTNAPRPSRVLS
jgi:hypothetical protein